MDFEKKKASAFAGLQRQWRDGRDITHPKYNSLICLRNIVLSTSLSCKKTRLRSTNVLGCAPTLAAFGRKSAFAPKPCEQLLALKHYSRQSEPSPPLLNQS
jgi:hypothetical protein